MADIAKGTVLNGRYELNEKIGRGGMAEVWSGTDTVLGRSVAIKIMLPQFAMDEEFVARFRNEAASAANLANPYIVNIYDWGHDGSVQYIVMEYVNGQDLKTLIRQKGILPPRSAAKIAAQVCTALATAHGQDIVHRDIKPQNIMVQPNGQVKVMDFGISRAKNSTAQKTQIVLGTAQYVSPEQAQGLELGAASDIYSLGIVLYESVTGELPFDGDDAVSVAIKQVEDDPVPPSHLVRGVDPAFEAIVLKALAKDPDDRFLSVQEMGAALSAYASGEAQGATQAMGAAGAQARSRARDTQAVPQTVALKPVNGNPRDALAAQHGGAGMQQQAEDVQDAPSNKKLALIAVATIAAVVAIAVAAFLFLFPAKTTVPDVSGMDEQAARAQIESANLSVRQVIETPSDDVAKGEAVRTDPGAGESVPAKSSVDIYVSSGPSIVTVPDVTGMDEQAAKSAIEAAGLRAVRDADVFSSDVAEGKVAQQSPQALASAESGTDVHYAISAGSDTVTVPDLAGLSEKDAMAALEKLGLRGLVGSRQPSDTVLEGNVVSQSPAKGLKVEGGTQVTFTVSTGPAQTKVPALLGLTQTAARSVLVNAGLELGDVTTEYSDEPQGTVISQSIKEGSTVSERTRIDIVVSDGPDPEGDAGGEPASGGAGAGTQAGQGGGASGAQQSSGATGASSGTSRR